MSLSISEHIRKRLSECPELTAKVGNRMFPIAVNAETRFPFIVYERIAVIPNSTKDGDDGDTVTENVYVFSESYSESVQIAEIVRKALDHSKGDYGNYEIDECIMTAADEAHDENIYMQQLVFTIQTI